jgi:hypothetical protein
MAWWITVYCRRSVSRLTPSELLAGITDRDRSAAAGVDYATLAEDYGVDADAVAPALAQLAVRATSDAPLDFEIGFATDGRPLVLHLWDAPERVAEELEEAKEVRSVPATIADRLAETKEIVAIELGYSHLEDMGIVFAFEVARYLAQNGDGLIVDDDDAWQVVDQGGFSPINADG